MLGRIKVSRKMETKGNHPASGESRHRIERENGRVDRADTLRTEYGRAMWLDPT